MKERKYWELTLPEQLIWAQTYAYCVQSKWTPRQAIERADATVRELNEALPHEAGRGPHWAGAPGM